MKAASLLVAVAGLLLSGCGLDTSKIPAHHVYARDGEEVKAGRSLSFAVVGSTRSVLYGVKGEPVVPKEVIADIRTQAPVRGLEFLVFTGGQVRRSTTGEWKGFSERWGDLIDSEVLSANKSRKKVLPLPGDGERLGDSRLKGYGAAFPDAGARIGYNRVASWGHVDLVAGGKTWRLLFLDTNKGALGSRWEEQLFWLPKVVSGDEFDKLVVFLADPLLTFSKTNKMNKKGASKELLDIIEDHSGIMKLQAVIAGGPTTNELILPGGVFGEAHVVAGNAGIGMPDLRRWAPADEAGLAEDLPLEPGFDLSLMREFERTAEAEGFSEAVIDKGQGARKLRGLHRDVRWVVLPRPGWWHVELMGYEMDLTFRMRRYDGTFFDLYTLHYDDSDGWQMRLSK